MEETAIITVFWAEGAAMPTADEIYFLGLMLVAGAPDMQLDLVAWSADVLAIQGPEFAEMQHLWRSPKAATDPGWWRRSSQLSMIIKNLPEKELLRCGEALSVLRPHVQPSANDIVRYRRRLKDKKLTGPLDTSAKNPLQRFAAASVGIARLFSRRASISTLRSAFENATGELALASATATRVQLQEHCATEQRRRKTLEHIARRLKKKLAQAKNMTKDEAQQQIRAAAEKMAARIASAKVKKAEKEAEKEKHKLTKSVAMADAALIDGLAKAGEKTARARKRARDMENKAGKSVKRLRDLQEMREANHLLRDENEQVRRIQPSPSLRAPRASTSELTAEALPVCW